MPRPCADVAVHQLRPCDVDIGAWGEHGGSEGPDAPRGPAPRRDPHPKRTRDELQFLRGVSLVIELGVAAVPDLVDELGRQRGQVLPHPHPVA